MFCCCYCLFCFCGAGDWALKFSREFLLFKTLRQLWFLLIIFGFYSFKQVLQIFLNFGSNSVCYLQVSSFLPSFSVFLSPSFPFLLPSAFFHFPASLPSSLPLFVRGPLIDCPSWPWIPGLEQSPCLSLPNNWDYPGAHHYALLTSVYD